LAAFVAAQHADVEDWPPEDFNQGMFIPPYTLEVSFSSIFARLWDFFGTFGATSQLVREPPPSYPIISP